MIKNTTKLLVNLGLGLSLVIALTAMNWPVVPLLVGIGFIVVSLRAFE